MPVLKFESNECLGANLQMMFTLMKESVRKSIDPNFFIRAIGLDENMQQVSTVYGYLMGLEWLPWQRVNSGSVVW